MELLHQFVHSPSDVQSSEVAVMLAHAQEDNGNASRVHHADKRANHVADCIALRNDEAIHADTIVA